MEDEETKLARLLFMGGSMSESPNKTTYVSKHYQMTIGIGNDHVATITLDEDAMKVLCARKDYCMSDFIAA